MTDLPPLGFVRALTFEEMTSEQRALYGPRRRHAALPQCDYEYDVLEQYDDQVPSCHREKP
jgi:hypothetical protein